MNRELLRERINKVSKVILKGGREYSGRIISIDDVGKTNATILLKDKYGMSITFESDDVVALEELML